MALSSLLQKLLFINKFNIINGKVELLGTRYIMLDSSYLLTLQEIDKSKTYDMAKDGSKENLKKLVTHAEVYKNIKNQSLQKIAELSKKIGQTDEGVIKTLQSIFELYGLGKLTVLKLENESKKALLKLEDSTIAVAQLKKEKTSQQICSFTAGVLAGIFSYIFKKNVNCIENKCLAKGDAYCEFKVY